MKRWVLRIAVCLLLTLAIAASVFYLRPLWVSDQILHWTMWRQGVKSRYINIDGHRIHYVEAGEQNARPLLLVHGLGSRIEDWAPLIPQFAGNGFHVYAPDLLGYGRSEQPRDADYSIGMQERLVMQYMDAMGIKQADVAGWSMGGWITMKMALDAPERVRRLVLYDAAGIYFGVDFSFDLFTPNSLGQVTGLLQVLEPTPRSLPEFAARDVIRRADKNGWVVKRSVAAMTNGRELLDFRLHGLKMPTLIMWGGLDHLTPLETGKRMHTLIPQSVFEVVEGCGHLAPRECVVPVLQGTVEFLNAEPPMRGGEKIWPAAK